MDMFTQGLMRLKFIKVDVNFAWLKKKKRIQRELIWLCITGIKLDFDLTGADVAGRFSWI
jgi:hypothetical protein